MTEADQHYRFTQALKACWDGMGGPVSLTSFLNGCRPVIAPLLERRVPWSWIAPRVLAVFRNPGAQVPADVAALDAEKRTLIQLYSRTTLRLRQREMTLAPSATIESEPPVSAPVPITLANGTDMALPSNGVDPPDDRRARRARIRQGADISNRLGQFEQ
jgi:hypothetical protein